MTQHFVQPFFYKPAMLNLPGWPKATTFQMQHLSALSKKNWKQTNDVISMEIMLFALYLLALRMGACNKCCKTLLKNVT